MNSPEVDEQFDAQKLIGGLVAEMAGRTRDKVIEEGLKNARENAELLAHGKSLAALRSEKLGEGETAVVIAAGPSLAKTDPAKRLLAGRYKGAVIATESALRYCLSNNLVPDLVVTVDPRPRLVRWFGDRNLSRETMEADRWFGRAGLDAYFADEMRANEEVARLVNQHGRGIRLAIATSSSRVVAERALEAGMSLYWWNPMYDDPDDPGSVTAKLQFANGMPAVNAGGNVGASCWMMASAVLGKCAVAVTGMDYSYDDGSPVRLTQHYRELCDIVGEENVSRMFTRIYNEYENAWYYTDPVYLWYREAFFEMVRDADCITANCTGGGILFGDAVEYMSLSRFLETYR